MDHLINDIFAISQDIRYAAIYKDHDLVLLSKPGTSNPSGYESDRYEELIVNPTILTAVIQRGNIDCGGAKFIIIRYGHFYQFVTPIINGHISICLEPHADVIKLAEAILGVLGQQGLLA